MAKDQKNCPTRKAVIEAFHGLLIEISNVALGSILTGRGGLNPVSGRKRLFEGSAIKAEEIALEGRGVEGNKSDLQRIEEIIPQISELMANLLITNGEGEIDREQMRRISVKVGKLSTKLLEVSLDGGEISEDSIQKKLLRYEIDAILREVIFNR